MYGHVVQLTGVVCPERLDALLEQRLEVVCKERGADANALLGGTHGVERIDGNAVVHQLAGKLQVVHARILYGEIEAVGKRCAHVVVIDEVEAVGEQHFLHELRAPAILPHIVEETIRTVAGCFHQGRHGMLDAVGGATGEGVHEAIGKEIAELAHTEVLLQRGEHAVIELVADAAHADALSGIGERL